MHHIELAAVQLDVDHNNVTNLYDVLNLIFHLDLGDEHLENYTVHQVQNLQNSFQWTIQSDLMYSNYKNVTLPKELIALNQFSREVNKKPLLIFHFSPYPLRAPPFCV